MKKYFKRNLILFFSIFFFTLFVDQLTKFLVSKYMFLYQSKVIIKKFLYFTYTENRGFLLGFLSHLNDGSTFNVIVITTIIAMIILIGVFIYLMIDRKTSVYLIITFSILIGGATGNFIDRLIRKKVIDFIEITGFQLKLGKYIIINSMPIFNMADFFVTTGIILFIIYFLFLEKKDITEKEYMELYKDQPELLGISGNIYSNKYSDNAESIKLDKVNEFMSNSDNKKEISTEDGFYRLEPETKEERLKNKKNQLDEKNDENPHDNLDEIKDIDNLNDKY